VPAAAGPVELSVYDLAGRRIRTLTRGALAPGRHTFLWDGRTDGGRRLAAGVYVSRLSGAARSVTRRATLVP
jgi:flagellar hook assembly protein FlgD